MKPAVAIAARFESRWSDAPHVAVGDVPTAPGTADRYVLVGSEDEPVMRVDVYGQHHGFEEAILWREYVAIGFADAVHLIRLSDLKARSFRLPMYFGYLHPLEDCLLVASAEDIRCFGPDLSLLWTSPALGVDGVLIDDVLEGEVRGKGEWDPPGGWRAFRIDLASGAALS